MSRETYQAFVARVKDDESLRREFRKASGGTAMPDAALVAFAAGKGYQFTVDDISHELSDDDLGKVSGGAYEFYVSVKGTKQKPWPQ